MLEILRITSKEEQFIVENIENRTQILDLFYNLSFSLQQFSQNKFHQPNRQNLLKILRITSNRLIYFKYHTLDNRRKNELISNFINLCRKLFNNYFIGDNFYRDDDLLREFLFEYNFEEYFERISENLEVISEEDQKTLTWLIRIISEEFDPEFDPKRTYHLNYFLIRNDFIGKLNYNSNQQLNTSFNREIINKTIYELENRWTPIENKNCKHLREQNFIFWGLGDFIVQNGIGFWSPYFTYKNNYKYHKLINVDLIIPNNILERTREIVGIYKGIIPELENPPRDLDFFWNPLHKWITNYLIDNIFLFEDNIDCDIIDFHEEYQTNEIGNIDILLEDINGTYWVVEIKKDEPNYNPIGQILNYMSWIRENKSGLVRGIIIVRNISPQLRSAFRELNRSDIQIWTYEISGNQQNTINKNL